jgi:cobalt-zinc-cadmium efflux system membrane fusion protein
MKTATLSAAIGGIARVLCLLFVLGASTSAWGHGGEDHGAEEEAPGASASTSAATATTSSSGQTSLGLRLSDLSRSGAGTEAPLVGAKISGLLKRADTGVTLTRISVHAGDAPGAYDVHFNGDNETFAFPGAGRYELELSIQPARGEAIDTTVPFSLDPAAKPAPAAALVPLWRRALPWVLSVAALGVLFALVRKLLARRRKTPPGAPGETKKRAPENVTVAVLLLALLSGGVAARVWAHGGEDHGEEEEAPAAAAPVPGSNAPTSGGNTGVASETTSTTTAGNIRITVIARTMPQAPQVLGVGEVSLAPQTVELLGIKTAPVQVSQLATGIAFSGQVAPDPNGTVRVASIVPGRVTRLNVAQGDVVRAGQVLATVESRAIGEAQSAYGQALARFNNAQSNLSVVQQQANAGVFSRTPLEAAQRTQAEAAGDVRQGEAAVRQAEVALNNATRVARVGGFASPALEAARNAQAQAREALRTAEAAQGNAQASVRSAQAELARRRQLAASGSYSSRPVEEARRALVAAQSARAAATSEVATTRANLNRARSLAAEGLVSKRDLEAAQQAFETATARLETSQADERAAQQEQTRQSQLATSNVAGAAEVQASQAALATAQADVQTRQAEAQRARTQLQVADVALSRERAIFGQNIANRREIEGARAQVQSARAGLYKAQRTLEVANATLARERLIFRRGLNNTSQVQTARSGLVQAQADLRAARSTLELLKSSPGGSVSVPLRAPIAGVVQTREAAVGELIQADAPLLTIVNLSRVALEAQLFEADFARVRIGAPVSVTTQAVPNRAFAGRISFLGSQVSSETRTVTARALIDNPGTLRPGMFARGQIQTGVGTPLATVPASAVLDDGAAKIVFVARGGKYLRREVALGNESGGRVEVKRGLKQGEVVVTEGAPALRAQAARGA